MREEDTMGILVLLGVLAAVGYYVWKTLASTPRPVRVVHREIHVHYENKPSDKPLSPLLKAHLRELRDPRQ